MKEFLLVQARPEKEAADEEFCQFIAAGGFYHDELARLQLDQQLMPDIDLDDFAGVLIGGSPYCLSDPVSKKSPVQRRVESELRPLIDEIIDRDFPYFGTCYGLGLLANSLEPGVVSQDAYAEESSAVEIKPIMPDAAADQLLQASPDKFKAFVGHKESVQRLPSGAEHLATSPDCPIQMIRAGKHIYAAQFHPELDGPGLASRIDTYKHSGYFRPDDADSLKEQVLKETVVEPARIFRTFVQRYRSI